MIFSIDKWENNINKGDETLIKSNEDVFNNLKLLNGKTITQLVANGKDRALIIGGGNDKFVVTYVEGDNEDFYNLINSDFPISDEEIEVVTGGQTGLFPRSIVVDFNTAYLGLLYFFKHQQRDPSMKWVND